MKRVIRLFYAFQFFFSMLLWLPIFYEYQKTIGLTDIEIFSIQSIYYFVFCLFEIPTGMAADRFGHRRCLVWGSGILVLSNLIPVFFQSYSGFLIHFVSIALSRSLISGASSAYIYDYLQKSGAVEVYKKIEGNARAYSLFGKVVFWAGVGPLMQWHMTLPYWLTAACSLVAVYMAMSLPPVQEIANQRVGPRFSSAEMVRRVREVWGRLLATPFLIFLMIQGVAIFVLARIAQVNLFQPILSSKQFDLTTFGMIMSLMTVFEGIGSMRPDLFKKVMNDFNAIYFLTIVMAVSLMLIPICSKAGVLAALCIFSLATGFSFPIQRQLMNDAIPDSKYRATLLSVESIVDRAANAILALFIGSFLAGGRLNAFLYLTGGVSVLLTLSLIVVGVSPRFSRSGRNS